MLGYQKIEEYRVEKYKEYKKKRNLGLVLLLIFPISIHFLRVAHKKRIVLTEEIKEKIITGLLGESGYEYACYTNNFLDDGTLRTCIDEVFSTTLFGYKSSNLYSLSDYIYGEYQGTKFQCFKFRTSPFSIREYEARKPRFHGHWFVFDYERNPKLNLLISQQALFRPMEGFKIIKTDFPNFSRKFKIATSNENAFSRCLTPKIISKILEFGERYKEEIVLGFINGKFHFGIDDKNKYLKINVSKSVNSKYIAALEAQLRMIGNIIDEFKPINDMIE